MRNKPELWVEERDFGLQFDFLLAVDYGDGRRSIGGPVEMREVNEREWVEDPTFRLRREQVQALFNELWRKGFRPQDGTGNSGHLDAIKYHLEDMRRLVFEKKEGGGA